MKNKEHRLDFGGSSGMFRKGIQLHMTSESWDYGRNHSLPLWTEYVIYPAILPRGYKFSQIDTTMTSFELVLEGCMTVIQDDARLSVNPCDICLIPAGKTKTLEVRQDCRKVVFGICGQLHLSLLAMTGILSRTIIRLKNPDHILAILRELYHHLKEKSQTAVPKISALSLELIMEISREAEQMPEPLLADALRFLEYNLSKPFQLSALAEKLHVTKDYLNRLFLKELGVPPKHYLINQRMQLGASLLKASSLSILEVAQRCGYKTQFAFSKEFRKKYGSSPLQYRKAGEDNKRI